MITIRLDSFVCLLSSICSSLIKGWVADLWGKQGRGVIETLALLEILMVGSLKT